jgi:hypothetical protein
MEKLGTGGLATKHQPAIIDVFQTKDVNVTTDLFVWDVTEWDALGNLAAGKLTPTYFKIKVSKACFLKVTHAHDTTSHLRFFQQGENNDVLVSVHFSADNKDEDGNAFVGSDAGGEIVAGVNW